MKRKIFFILTILFLFIGCKPHSINTATSSAAKVLDSRFDGTWIAQDNSGCMEVKNLQDGRIEIKAESNTTYNRTDYIVATVYSSTIKNNHYFSIKVHNKGDLKNGYLLAKYNLINDNTMKFSYIDSIALKHLIASKNVKGEMSVITDKSENIELAIGKYDNLLFKDYMIFNKGTCPSNYN